jgi:hypothetical protein
MSLTRDQWVEMWNSILYIELNSQNVEEAKRCKCSSCRAICNRIKIIKNHIESVIGQMRTSKEEL